MLSKEQTPQIQNFSFDRWKGIERNFTPSDVEKLSGTVQVKHTLAELGATTFWNMLHTEEFIPTLGAFTGNQALQMVKAGLKAIYLSGWQVAADANNACQMYPDQSLYPCSSVPEVVKRINNAFIRADQIQKLETHQGEKHKTNFFVPIIADAESGFGGSLNSFEIMKAMIEAGAAAVHFEDQLSSEKKCGHLGGKVLIPTATFIKHLNAARLAADIMKVSTVIIARTDAFSAQYITNDMDSRDKPFICGSRTEDGFFPLDQKRGLEHAIARGLAFAPYADLLWWETSEPNLEEAQLFANEIHKKFPGKLLAYNCSPSFNWTAKLSPKEINEFQRRLAQMGYKFQFVTLAGFHCMSLSAFQLAMQYTKTGMEAYADLQKVEFEISKSGYTAIRHQREVGTSYFDAVNSIIGNTTTSSMKHSTEKQQFQ